MKLAADEEWYWLREIAESVSGNSPWTDLVGTFLATLVGAGAALAGTWFIFRRESHERYNARLDEALSRVLFAGSEVIAELEDFKRNPMLPKNGPFPVLKPVPEGAQLFTSWAAARLVGRGQDLTTLAAIRGVLANFDAVSMPDRIAMIDDVTQLITMWRSEEVGLSTVLSAARASDKRHSMATTA